MTIKNPTRRKFIRTACSLPLIPILQSVNAAPNVVPYKKPIPSSGEKIPVIGMGTSITFNVGDSPEIIAQRTEVLKMFFQMGGGMVDSSPMYGSAERVLGHCLSELKPHTGLFSATKVWNNSFERGQEQIVNSHQLWRINKFDLFQVHNLVGWQEQLPYLQQLKQDGKLRYVGISTSHGRRHAELLEIMERDNLDFVQLTYNIVDREVEQYLLPLAKERGIAVIANRPFQRDRLIDFVEQYPLPKWSAEIDCKNWAQFLLKYIVSHPAVTCAIPATRRVDHMQENMGAAFGKMPDASMRKRMAKYVAQL